MKNRNKEQRKSGNGSDSPFLHGKFLLLLSLLSLTACASQKAYTGFDNDFDSSKPRAELRVQLPPYPERENLLPFDPGPANNNRHYIDGPSIAVGRDGVIRYTLVIESPQGATNVTYEGMRCATEGARENVRLDLLILKFEVTEKRLYAIGREDKTWMLMRDSKWEELEDVSQHYPQRALARYFFCPGNLAVRNEKEAVQALKNGAHPRAMTP